MKVQTSLACWPGLHIIEAALRAREEVYEPLFGKLGVEHVQIVPQCLGILDMDCVDQLYPVLPHTQYRLHANVRVTSRRVVYDLGNFAQTQEQFAQAAHLSKALGAPAYSAHAGYRKDATMAQMLDNARRCADLFGCPVAVEGLYPSEDSYLVSTWSEYEELFLSGVPYALDLSHLNILVHRSEAWRQNPALLQMMLASERCIEVHVSANDGTGDHHQVCEDPYVWWFPLLKFVNPAATVFTEGNHRRKRNATRSPT